jgi:hypothetical protein
MKLHVCGWILCGATLLAPPSLRARSDPTECVAWAERCQRRYEHFSATLETRAYSVKEFDDGDGSIPVDGLMRVESAKLWRDGQTARCYQRNLYRRMNRGAVSERVEVNEFLATSQRRLLVSHDQLEGRDARVGVTAQTGNATNDPLSQLVFLVGGFLFTGRTDAKGPCLAERFKATEPAIVMDQQKGRAAVRIDFEDDWGTLSVWFDPVRDHHPLRLVQRKQSRHFVRPNVRMDHLPENPRYGRMAEVESEIVVTGLRQVSGNWYAAGFERRIKFTTTDLKQAASKDVTRILEISPDPRAGGNQFKVTTPVPNGTRVTVDNQIAIGYEWRDGEIVKSVNQPAARTLAKQEYHRPTWWWLWPTATILAAGCLVILLRLRRSTVP